MNGSAIRWNDVASRLAMTTGAMAAGLAVLVLLLLLTGHDPLLALAAMWRGAFGSADALLSATLPRAIPLIIIGLGVGLAFRAGALNIGAEGQFYAGAIAAASLGVHLDGWPHPLAIATICFGAALAGLLWVAVPAALRFRFGVLEVISTLLLNFVAEALVSWMVQGPLQEAKHIYPQTDPIAVAGRLPHLLGTRLHLGLVLALVIAGGLWVFYTRTVWGFQLRAAGAGSRAAEVTGRINTKVVIAVALLSSGALAGLAGGVEVSGVSFALFQNLSPGYGFTAIAVALLARLDPLATVGTGVLFAALEAGAGGMQREAGVPAVLVYVVEAVVIIVVLLVSRRRD